MHEKNKENLESAVIAIQDRWGSRAVRRLNQEQMATTPHIPTGFPTLDKALAIGGLPVGRISEIVGVPTSGMATIALHSITQAQKKTGMVVYMDSGSNFDPPYAAQWGLDLNQLVLVRPFDSFQSLAIMQDFILGGGLSALVFDTDQALFDDPQLAKALAMTVDRIIAPLSRSSCLLLFLTPLKSAGSSAMNSYPRSSILPHHAAVRLFIQREKWLYRQGDIQGYQAQVLVVKNKLGPSGKEVTLTIDFDARSQVSAFIDGGNS